MGLCHPIRPPDSLALHLDAKCSIDTETGIVYGLRGLPVGQPDPRGYVRVWIKRRVYRYAHRLVAEVCYGAIPSGHQVDHVNGDKSDNRPANLQVVTARENTARAFRNGLAPIGSKRKRAKLTESAVSEIRHSVDSGSVLGKRYGVHKETVNKARRGSVWKHVTTPPARIPPGRRPAN